MTQCIKNQQMKKHSLEITQKTMEKAFLYISEIHQKNEKID